MKKEFIAIPDIHGMYSLLSPLLQKAMKQWPPGLYQYIFLGDYVDRGPDSAAVIETLKHWQKNHGAICLAGNHEWLMVDAFENSKPHADEIWYYNGGHRTKDSFGSDRKEMEQACEWIKSLPLYHETEDFFFSHAPAPEHERKQGEFSKEGLIWNYEPHDDSVHYAHFPDKVGVCGHIHKILQGTFQPRFFGHYYFLDCGCGCAELAPLVAVNVNTREVLYQYPPGASVTHSEVEQLK